MALELTAGFQNRFAALADRLQKAGEALPALSAADILAAAHQRGAELEALRADVARAKARLPDGRIIGAWEHEALVELARVNGVAQDIIFQRVAQTENQRILDLNLSNLNLSDIAAIAPLSGLAALRLDRNRLSDVRALSRLTGLKELNLSYNGLTDAGALADLSQLWGLELAGNQLTDIRPLAGLTQLQALWLDANLLSDIGPLAGLTALRFLSLADNEITDIRVVAEQAQLEHLCLWGNQIADISPLAGLSQLRRLSLRDNPLTDASRLLMREFESRGVDVRSQRPTE